MNPRSAHAPVHGSSIGVDGRVATRIPELDPASRPPELSLGSRPMRYPCQHRRSQWGPIDTSPGPEPRTSRAAGQTASAAAGLKHHACEPQRPSSARHDVAVLSRRAASHRWRPRMQGRGASRPATRDSDGGWSYKVRNPPRQPPRCATKVCVHETARRQCPGSGGSTSSRSLCHGRLCHSCCEAPRRTAQDRPATAQNTPEDPKSRIDRPCCRGSFPNLAIAEHGVVALLGARAFGRLDLVTRVRMSTRGLPTRHDDPLLNRLPMYKRTQGRIRGYIYDADPEHLATETCMYLSGLQTTPARCQPVACCKLFPQGGTSPPVYTRDTEPLIEFNSDSAIAFSPALFQTGR